MLLKLRSRQAQTLMEYAILFGIVIMALMGMQIYVKRGIQGKIRSTMVQGSSGATLSGYSQYEPYYFHSKSNSTGNSAVTIDTGEVPGGTVTRDSNENSRRFNGTEGATVAQPGG